MNKKMMKCMVLLFILAVPLYGLKAQEEGLQKLDFLVGKWEAHANDSSFSSVLQYQFSPHKRLLMATNYLYNREGDLFATYEGAYLYEVDHLAYFIAGPGGETHRGTADINQKSVTHRAKMFPGTRVKSYLSEMRLEDNRLLYYANYSNEEDFPSSLDHSNPLVYIRKE